MNVNEFVFKFFISVIDSTKTTNSGRIVGTIINDNLLGLYTYTSNNYDEVINIFAKSRLFKFRLITGTIIWHITGKMTSNSINLLLNRINSTSSVISHNPPSIYIYQFLHQSVSNMI